MSLTAPAAVDVAIVRPASTISVRPVLLPAADRGEDLQVRVTAPTTGKELPIVVFLHGFGSSMDDYAPGRVALVQRVTTAYLRSALDLGNAGWSQVRAALRDGSDPLGRIESR